MASKKVEIRWGALLDLAECARANGKDVVPLLLEAAERVDALAPAQRQGEDAWLTRIAVSTALAEVGAEAVPELTAALRSPAFGRAYAAAIALRQIGQPAVEELIEALDTGELDVTQKKRAIWALGGIPDPKSTNQLLSYLGDRALQADAAFALVTQGEPAIPALSEKLSAGTVPAAVWAAWALSQNGDAAIPVLKKTYEEKRNTVAGGLAAVALQWMKSRGVPTLLAELRGGNSQLACVAAYALKEMGGPAVKPLIEVVANDKEPREARLLATWALASSGSPSAARALTRVSKEEDPIVRRNSRWALGRLGAAPPAKTCPAGHVEVWNLRGATLDARWTALLDLADCARAKGKAAVPLLVKALEDVRIQGQGDDPWLTRLAVATAAAGIGKAAVPDLTQALRAPSFEESFPAAIALKEIGEPAVSGLAKMAQSGDVAQKQRAIWILGGVPSPKSRSALLAALSDEEVRADAAFALVNQGEGAIPDLAKRISSRDASVAVWATWSLSQLGGAAIPTLKRIYDTRRNQTEGGLAAAGLQWIGPEAIPTLVGELTSGDSQRAGLACITLREMGQPAADMLLKLASDTHQAREVRLLAIWGLATMGDRRAVPVLEQMSQEKDPIIRRDSRWGLRKLGR